MKQIQTATTYFPALTGVRAVAAFMVYFHHNNPISIVVFGAGLHNFFSEMHIGVTIFFVLSGFLITYRYYNLKHIPIKKYIINRLSRIYPMYFLLTSLTFVFSVMINPVNILASIKLYVLNCTFLKGFFDNFKFTGIAQGWSLTVEEMFYLLAPFFFMLIKKGKYFLIILPIVILLSGFLLVFVFKNSSFYGLMSSINFMLDYTFFGRCIEFFIGIGLAIYIKKFHSFKNMTYFGIAFILFFIFIFSILKEGSGYGTDGIFGKIINTLLLPFFGIVPLFIGLMQEETTISKIFKSELFQILGKSSYVFYLIHIGVFVVILDKISDNYIFQFFTLNVLAIVMYLFLEKPIHRFIQNKFAENGF